MTDTAPQTTDTAPVQMPSGLMRAATYAALVSAGLLVTVKGFAYFSTHSVAMLSSLADSALDLLASGVNFIAVRHALTPADREHRFGHGKAEPLSGLAQAAFVAGSAVLLAVEAATRFGDPVPVQNGMLGIGVMLFSTVVTFMLVAFQRYVVKHTSSVAISADSLHYTGDVMLNISVMAAIAASFYLGWAWVDPVFAIGVAVFLTVNAVRIAVKSVTILMDRELPDEDRARILAVARQHPKVKNIHELRTRSSGLQRFIQMHIVLDQNLTLLEAHRISDDVEAALESEFPGADIIIHQDPEGIVEIHRPVGSNLH